MGERCTRLRGHLRCWLAIYGRSPRCLRAMVINVRICTMYRRCQISTSFVMPSLPVIVIGVAAPLACGDVYGLLLLSREFQEGRVV